MNKQSKGTKKKFGDKTTIIWTDACEITGWKPVSEAIKIPDEVFCKNNRIFFESN